MKITGAQIAVHLHTDRGTVKTKYTGLHHKLNRSLSEKSGSLIK
jgi:hypothetical protein